MDSILDFIHGNSISAGGVPFTTLLLVLLMACAIGQVIGWIYMFTHVSPSYSKSYSASLVTLPVIVALMMILMAGNTAIAFGLLAVFAVVRFRNVLKDTRDTTFILFAIVEGMGVGTLHFAESLAGLLIVGLLLVYLWISDFGGRHQFDALLSVDLTESEGGNIDQRLRTLLQRHASQWRRTGEQHLTANGTSVSYQLLMRDPTRSEDLRSELLQRSDVNQISLMVKSDHSET